MARRSSVDMPALAAPKTVQQKIAFPISLKFGDAGKPFAYIGRLRGKGWDIQMVADEFRREQAG